MKKKINKATVSIAVFNKLEYTKQCVLALFKNTPLELFDLIIVNNASTDDTTQWLAEELPKLIPFNKNRITILNNFQNLGFAKAHNQAFKECKTEYFLPLNNDTIPLKNWLEPMINDLDTMSEVGIVGSKLISPLINGIQSCGTVFEGLTPIHRFFSYPSNHPLVSQKEYVPAITAACMLMRSSLFKEIGGFDERYLNGWEDVDLSLRVTEKRWKILYEPLSVLYHYEATTDSRFMKDNENRRLFMQIWSKKLLNGLGQETIDETKKAITI